MLTPEVLWNKPVEDAGENEITAAASVHVELSPNQRSTVVRLASLSGRAFDKSFKETVDAGHVQELAMYRAEASHTVDPGLRDLAQRRVVTLEQTVAQAIQAAKAKPKNDW